MVRVGISTPGVDGPGSRGSYVTGVRADRPASVGHDQPDQRSRRRALITERGLAPRERDGIRSRDEQKPGRAGPGEG